MAAKLTHITNGHWFDQLLKKELSFDDIPLSKEGEGDKVGLHFLGNNHNSSVREHTIDCLLTIPIFPLNEISDYGPIFYARISTKNSTIVPFTKSKLQFVAGPENYVIIEEIDGKKTHKRILPYTVGEEFATRIVNVKKFKELLDLWKLSRQTNHLKEVYQLTRPKKNDINEAHIMYMKKNSKLCKDSGELYKSLQTKFKKYFDTALPVTKEMLQPNHKYLPIGFGKKPPSNLSKFFEVYPKIWEKIYLYTFATFEENPRFNDTQISKEQLSQLKEINGLAFPQVLKYRKNFGTLDNVASLMVRLTFTFTTYFLLHRSGSDYDFPEDFIEPAKTLVLNYGLTDLACMAVNGIWSYMKTGVALTTGVVGTVREILQDNNFYDEHSKLSSE